MKSNLSELNKLAGLIRSNNNLRGLPYVPLAKTFAQDDIKDVWAFAKIYLEQAKLKHGTKDVVEKAYEQISEDFGLNKEVKKAPVEVLPGHTFPMFTR